MRQAEIENIKRRPVNLTIREDIINDAKSLNLNASKAAEDGIREAIKKAHEEQWLKENKVGITAHNRRVEKYGTLIAPNWSENA